MTTAKTPSFYTICSIETTRDVKGRVTIGHIWAVKNDLKDALAYAETLGCYEYIDDEEEEVKHDVSSSDDEGTDEDNGEDHDDFIHTFNITPAAFIKICPESRYGHALVFIHRGNGDKDALLTELNRKII